MNIEYYAKKMADNANTIRQMTEGIADEQARWKPDPGAWSILEVVNHLYDEEREDFRVRLDVMLHRPQESLPKWDPVGAVRERDYQSRDFGESVDKYMRERGASIEWLTGLVSPNWEAVYENPNFRMSAGDMFASWYVHDLLHMRQIVTLQWKYSVIGLMPHSVDYAGAW